jgi:hypothetical protein
MIGLNSREPQIYWNGVKLLNIKSIQVDWDDDDTRIKLKVSSIDPVLFNELMTGGVNVRIAGAKHE